MSVSVVDHDSEDDEVCVFTLTPFGEACECVVHIQHRYHTDIADLLAPFSPQRTEPEERYEVYRFMVYAQQLPVAAQHVHDLLGGRYGDLTNQYYYAFGDGEMLVIMHTPAEPTELIIDMENAGREHKRAYGRKLRASPLVARYPGHVLGIGAVELTAQAAQHLLPSLQEIAVLYVEAVREH